MRSEPKLTGLSGNEIYCMRLKGLTPSGVVIGNSIQSMGFVGGVRSVFSKSPRVPVRSLRDQWPSDLFACAAAAFNASAGCALPR